MFIIRLKVLFEKLIEQTYRCIYFQNSQHDFIQCNALSKHCQRISSSHLQACNVQKQLWQFDKGDTINRPDWSSDPYSLQQSHSLVGFSFSSPEVIPKTVPGAILNRGTLKSRVGTTQGKSSINVQTSLGYVNEQTASFVPQSPCMPCITHVSTIINPWGQSPKCSFYQGRYFPLYLGD